MNDLSIHGQFSSTSDFCDAIERLMEIRTKIKRAGSELFCHRNLADSQVTPDMVMRQAIQAMRSEKRRAWMQWLTRGGPYWIENRQHSDDEWLETLTGTMVTDNAVGEAAYCRLHQLQRETVSVDPSDWLQDPLNVIWRKSDNTEIAAEVPNHWTLESVTKVLNGLPKPYDSWTSLENHQRSMCDSLILADNAFAPLEGHPYVKSVAERIHSLLDVLNKLDAGFDDDGNRTIEFTSLYEDLDAVVSFVERVPLEALPAIATALNELLDTPPLLEQIHCEISQRFGWLVRAAGHVAQRLIEGRSTAALGHDVLSILRKLPMAHRAAFHDYRDASFRFSELVPSWPELNRALFWHDVHHSQKRPDGAPTEFWQVSVSGSYWRFSSSDFDYVLEQLADAATSEDKQIALSLAFRLYVECGRERKQRNRLKKLVANDKLLGPRLANYLRPPARGRSSWRAIEAKYKRQSAARKRLEERKREESKEFLKKNVDKLRDNGLARGKISQPQFYVHERMRERSDRSSRLSNSDWRCLVEEFGEEVALAFRDGATRYWRNFVPTLRSEGAPTNKIPFAVVFGLTGLYIEANETENWPVGLTADEAELACRYASYELNGFPSWLPQLFESFPSVVSDFLLKEIHHELTSEKGVAESHYILSDVSWHGEWAWDQLAPDAYALLGSKEPVNLGNLVLLSQAA